MKQSFNRKFQRTTYEIFAGDYYATKEQQVVLTTLLGSCISVCLRDKVTGIVGINHFMLPSTVRIEEIIFSADARYGINAMELMINAMLKLGARKQGIEAKVFGGGKVLDTVLSNVSQSNIDFAMAYLKMEEIPIVAKDVGGTTGRKLFFFPDTFSVFLKRIVQGENVDDAVSRERRFLKAMQVQKIQAGDLTLFDK